MEKRYVLTEEEVAMMKSVDYLVKQLRHDLEELRQRYSMVILDRDNALDTIACHERRIKQDGETIAELRRTIKSMENQRNAIKMHLEVLQNNHVGDKSHTVLRVSPK